MITHKKPYQITIICKNCKKTSILYLNFHPEQGQIKYNKFVCRHCGKKHDINPSQYKIKKIDKIRQISQQYNKGGTNKMAINRTVKESITIPEGRHTGIIQDIREREQEYKGKPIYYIDFRFTLDDVVATDNGRSITVKVGFPDNLSVKSSLGRFLISMGLTLTENKDVDIESLLGKKISYVTINKTTANGEFAEVNKDSIKPDK
jgi:hypothetical protein